MIRLDSRDARPIYEQVMDSLRRLVVSGAIQPGEKLPSVRAMATTLALLNRFDQTAAELIFLGLSPDELSRRLHAVSQP